MDTTQFDDRVTEIESYIDFLCIVEQEAQSGPPEIGNAPITTRQQRMLYSSVYLHLYNLVEATATWCMASVSRATVEAGAWSVGQLDSAIRKEWVRTNFRTHVQLNSENRFESSVETCESILASRRIEPWDVEKGGGGSWDDSALEKICERIGCVLNINTTIKADAKRPFRDDKNALEYVKALRNKLAHGSISFEQSGENVTVRDLVLLKDRTVNYLREVVQSIQTYVERFLYLNTNSRSVARSST